MCYNTYSSNRNSVDQDGDPHCCYRMKKQDTLPQKERILYISIVSSVARPQPDKSGKRSAEHER